MFDDNLNKTGIMTVNDSNLLSDHNETAIITVSDSGLFRTKWSNSLEPMLSTKGELKCEITSNWIRWYSTAKVLCNQRFNERLKIQHLY